MPIYGVIRNCLVHWTKIHIESFHVYNTDISSLILFPTKVNLILKKTVSSNSLYLSHGRMNLIGSCRSAVQNRSFCTTTVQNSRTSLSVFNDMNKEHFTSSCIYSALLLTEADPRPVPLDLAGFFSFYPQKASPVIIYCVYNDKQQPVSAASLQVPGHKRKQEIKTKAKLY